MLACVSDSDSPFGLTTLVLGPESYLAERVVADIVARCRSERPDLAVSTVAAGALDDGRLFEITGTGLFAEAAVAVITGLESLATGVDTALVQVAGDLPAETALVCVHPGGAKGAKLVERLRASRRVRVVDVAQVKPWELPKFVVAEARRRQGRADVAAAQALVDAVGTDTRALAAAVAQLLADAEKSTITVAQVRRYFAGRADATSFAVAEDVIEGRRTAAIERLRWALGTGVPPVLVTSALATSLRQLGRYIDSRGTRVPEAVVARDVGVPPWKLKDVARRARDWDNQAIALGIRAVAAADASVKGAAADPEFALERLILTLADARDAAGRR